MRYLAEDHLCDTDYMWFFIIDTLVDDLKIVSRYWWHMEADMTYFRVVLAISQFLSNRSKRERNSNT